MSMPSNLPIVAGTWIGTTHLYMPGESTRTVPSSAMVASAAQGQFRVITYTWSFDGQSQDGLLIVGQTNEPPTITVAWIDSWHMGDKVMLCHGQAKAPNEMSVYGSYQVQNSPDWGWHIVISPTSNELRIVMHNVAPGGDEFLAVEALYTHVAD